MGFIQQNIFRALFTWLAAFVFLSLLAGTCPAQQTTTIIGTPPPPRKELPAEYRNYKNRPQHVKINGHQYDRADVIRDFVNIAFTQLLWNEDTGPDYKTLFKIWSKQRSEVDSPFQRGHFEHEQAEHPWLAEYLYRQRGLPKADAINKWQTPSVSIALGWPAYTLRAESDGPPLGYVRPEAVLSEQASTAIRELIDSVIPQLEATTGLKIRLLPFNSPEDKTDQYARIRIIPATVSMYGNFFKTSRSYLHDGALADGGWSIAKAEFLLWGGVQFTPYLGDQVDGYLLPEADNSLGMSVCKINHVVGKDLMLALLSECLIRTMGLPGVSTDYDTDLLGHWNKEYAQLSPPLATATKGPIDKDTTYKAPPANQGFPAHETDHTSLSGLSEYDRLMLKLLYCDQITPAMGRNEAVSLLATEDKCFGEFLVK